MTLGKKVLGLVAVLAVVALAPAANASVCASTTDCTFTFNTTSVGAFGAGPYGTVRLQLSGTFINFTVDLADGFHLIDTGAHEAFAFDNTFSPATVTMTLFSDAAYSQGAGNSTNPPFSTFEDNVVSTCTNGGGCGVNVLTFQVSRVGGFTDVNQLVELSTGAGTAAYFAADVSCFPTCPGSTANGNTGAIGATGPGVSTVPEPITSGLVGTGLVSLFFLRRKKA